MGKRVFQDAVNRTQSTGLTHSNEKPDLDRNGDAYDVENDQNAANVRILDSSLVNESHDEHVNTKLLKDRQ